MPTKVKIKIEDNSELRRKIDELYERTCNGGIRLQYKQSSYRFFNCKK